MLADEIKQQQTLLGKNHSGDITRRLASSSMSTSTHSSPQSDTKAGEPTVSGVRLSYRNSMFKSPSPEHQNRASDTSRASIVGLCAPAHSLAGHMLESNLSLPHENDASVGSGVFSIPVFACAADRRSATACGTSRDLGAAHESVHADSRGGSYRALPYAPANGSMHGHAGREEGHWNSLALGDQMQSLMSDMDQVMSKFRIDPAGVCGDLLCLSQLLRSEWLNSFPRILLRVTRAI